MPQNGERLAPTVPSDAGSIDIGKLDASGKAKVHVGNAYQQGYAVRERHSYSHGNTIYNIHNHGGQHYYTSSASITPVSSSSPFKPQPPGSRREHSAPSAHVRPDDIVTAEISGSLTGESSRRGTSLLEHLVQILFVKHASSSTAVDTESSTSTDVHSLAPFATANDGRSPETARPLSLEAMSADGARSARHTDAAEVSQNANSNTVGPTVQSERPGTASDEYSADCGPAADQLIGGKGEALKDSRHLSALVSCIKVAGDQPPTVQYASQPPHRCSSTAPTAPQYPEPPASMRLRAEFHQYDIDFSKRLNVFSLPPVASLPPVRLTTAWTEHDIDLARETMRSFGHSLVVDVRGLYTVMVVYFAAWPATARNRDVIQDLIASGFSPGDAKRIGDENEKENRSASFFGQKAIFFGYTAARG